MSRYTGPKVKKLRAFGVDLPGLSRKSQRDRPYVPGEHGQSFRRKPSPYGERLIEKQKVRFNYGLSEKQMRRLMSEARRSQMAAGDKLMELLERRLDNVVFRSGFAPTIPAARQLVNHGHFTVNGKKVNIPSYRVDTGDIIAPRQKSMNLECIEVSLENPPLSSTDWIGLDADKKTASVNSLPTIEAVPFPLDIQLVVEYYSRLL
ncbi:30S ribosomal protein S4 [Candidatus Poribacteria bacterium]|nr:30S ribosomal protein S4 [Candidatus Poribacteria bacterium]